MFIIREIDNDHHIGSSSSSSKFVTQINFASKIIRMEQPLMEEKFVPKGAMVFFVLLVLLCLVIWFGIYFLMLGRV